MANAIVNTFKQNVMNGDFDLTNDTIKLMLLTSTHTQDIDAHEFIDDVSANEITASGTYAAGGVTLANAAATVDDTNDLGKFDADDVSITGATITAQYAAIYKDTGTPSTSPIIGIFDFGSEVSSFASTYTISFHADGILTIT